MSYNCYYDTVWYAYYQNVLMDDPYVTYDSETGEPEDTEYAKYYFDKEESLPFFHKLAKQIYELSRSGFWFFLTAINLSFILILGISINFKIKELYPYLILYVILLGDWWFYFEYVFD